MEKPSTFDRAFWILWISFMVQMVLSEINAIFDSAAAKHRGYDLTYFALNFGLFLIFTLFYVQIKKAKDWARILNVVLALAHPTLGIFNYLYDFYIGEFKEVLVGTQILFVVYIFLNILNIYASLIVFSKKSTEYINFQYHLKQDLKRREKENNSSKN